MEREIFYDHKEKRFYHTTKSKMYIDKNTILKKFLGDSSLLYYNLNQGEIGFLLDIENQTRIDFYLFKTYQLVTSLKFTENFDYTFQDFSFPDLINYKVNVLLPKNFYGLLTIENSFNENQITKGNSSLLLIDRKDCKPYRFLANNIYDNSSICFGDYPKKIENYYNLAHRAYLQFSETPCNSDLSFPNSHQFLHFKVSDENLIHDPLKFSTNPIGVTSDKMEVIKKIMGEF